MLTIEKIKNNYSSKIDPLDLDLLISFVIRKNREFVLSHPESKLSESQFKKIENFVKRRQEKEPLAYIIREKEFYGINFAVNKFTLIPRPETEILIEWTLDTLKNYYHLPQNLSLIDVGTGSGNIAITLSKELESLNLTCKKISIFATDKSNGALKIARQNASEQNLSRKLNFFCGDLLSPLIKNDILEQNSLLIILANLPYLSEEIYKGSPLSVRKYEPRSALFSPKRGLSHYENLFKQILKIKSQKNKKIIIFLEISPEQEKTISILIKKYFPQSEIEFKKDLAKKWRVIKIELQNPPPILDTY